MDVRVSVIIPAYNAEKTLRRCVESVTSQSFRNVEILLIDDGSQDGTPALCDLLADEDSRVRVFHKENGGVSAARNLGLAEAQGAYILFADSDDWLAPGAIASMVGVADVQESDLVIADYFRVSNGAVQSKGRIPDAGPMDAGEFLRHFTDSPSAFYFGVLWNKLYRREIIAHHGLRLDAGFSWCEDLLFNMTYYTHVNSVYVLRQPVYYYVRNMDSLSTQHFNLIRLGRIRLKVFVAYRRFARETFSPAAYRAWRWKAPRFFYAGLIDEFAFGQGTGERQLFSDPSSNAPLALSRKKQLG